MTIDHDEPKRNEAWQEACRVSAVALGVDPYDEDPAVLDLIFGEAESLMKDWGIPLPKSVKQPPAQEE